MDCEFHFQDPASPDTVYLLEAIIDASRGAASCSGIFAFASRGGVDSLLGDPEIQDFLRESPMSLLVGIDAVTTRNTLVRLRELEQELERLDVRVFRNPTAALFHPKVARFEYPDGRRTMIVGSGNLTRRASPEHRSLQRHAGSSRRDLRCGPSCRRDSRGGSKRHDRRACEAGPQASPVRFGARLLPGCPYAVHVRAAVEAVRRSFGDHESVGAAWADMLASRWREEPLATSGTPPFRRRWASSPCASDDRFHAIERALDCGRHSQALGGRYARRGCRR